MELAEQKKVKSGNPRRDTHTWGRIVISGWKGQIGILKKRQAIAEVNRRQGEEGSCLT